MALRSSFGDESTGVILAASASNCLPLGASNIWGFSNLGGPQIVGYPENRDPTKVTPNIVFPHLQAGTALAVPAPS